MDKPDPIPNQQPSTQQDDLESGPIMRSGSQTPYRSEKPGGRTGINKQGLGAKGRGKSHRGKRGGKN